MSHIPSVWAFQQKLSPMMKLVLICLADHADPSGICWPSFNTIAEWAGLSQPTVIKYIQKLEDANIIKSLHRDRDNGSHTSNLYQLLIPETFTVTKPKASLDTPPSKAPLEAFPTPFRSPSKAPLEEEPTIINQPLEPATVVTTTPQLLPLEIPQWLEVLHNICSKDQKRDSLLISWGTGHAVETLLETAHSLVQGWDLVKGKYKDPRKTFIGWVRVAENGERARGVPPNGKPDLHQMRLEVERGASSGRPVRHMRG